MEVTRIFDILEQHATVHQNEIAFSVKRNGNWESFSSKHYKEYANWLSYGLLEMGLQKGDKIASISNNRPEWNFLDMALAQTGMVHVPIYPTLSEEELVYILQHSESRYLFVSSDELAEKTQPLLKQVSTLKDIYTFDEISGRKNWNEIVESGKIEEEKFETYVEQIKTTIHPNDLFTIIYTSGTTGTPKGVMLSHDNFLSNIKVVENSFPLYAKEKALSFLPLCHVLERMVNYFYQNKGMQIFYAESSNTIGENMREINPVIFIAVPRVLEKIYGKIFTKGKELSGIKKNIFFWAMNLGLRFELHRKNGWFYHFQLKIADKLVFSKWRQAVGGNIRFIACGGASLQERLTRLFWAAGIPIMEGYGLTETSPLISINFYDPKDAKIGCVGPLVKTSQLKFADDGEILFKGPNLMLGYFKEPELTKSVIDEEGWFHTGDIGVFEDERFLRITDRKKEIFKLSTGKYIAPQVIENKFKAAPFIEQIMVVGESQKFVSAIISPNFEFLHDWCAIHHVFFSDNDELISKDVIYQRYERVVNELNQKLDPIHQIKKFVLVADEWTTDSGALSPTLKMKRKFLTDKYQSIIHDFYSGDIDNDVL